jgi:hypothetical protein
MTLLPYPARPPSRNTPRRGVAAIWALVVLSVLTTVLAATTWQVMAGRRLLDRRQDQLQAAWLARAGVELAAARLLTNPAGYKGESLELIPGSQIRIEVRSEPGSPDIFLVTSEARKPKDGSRPVVRSVTHRLRRSTEKDRARIEVLAGEEPAKGADQPPKK